MEAVLTSFLAPLLPYLLKKGEALADRAIDHFGAEVWERAKGLWAKLRPKVDDKDAAREAAVAVADNPDDEAARGALQFQLRTLLQSDPTLKAEVERAIREAQAGGVMASDGAVIIHGDVKADRGSVAAGRDVDGGTGGIQTSWRGSDDRSNEQS